MFKQQYWRCMVVGLGILLTNAVYTSQESQLMTYQWPKGQLPFGVNEGQGIPKLVKSIAFARLNKDGKEASGKAFDLPVVDCMNERFRSFIWAYVMEGGTRRRVDMKYTNHIVGTLEAFRHDNVDTPEGALCEMQYIEEKVLPAILLVQKELSISGRGGVAGSLSIEDTYGPFYKKIIQDRINYIASVNNASMAQEENAIQKQSGHQSKVTVENKYGAITPAEFDRINPTEFYRLKDENDCLKSTISKLRGLLFGASGIAIGLLLFIIHQNYLASAGAIK